MTESLETVALNFQELAPEQMLERGREYAELMSRRRTVRDFSDRQIAPEIIENAVRAAGSAPNGANLQPWHFVAVRDAAVKAKIREAAEAEEREFYGRRAPEEWLDRLAPLGTDAEKPFLQIAPYLIAIFYQRHGVNEAGEKFKTYYYSPEYFKELFGDDYECVITKPIGLFVPPSYLEPYFVNRRYALGLLKFLDRIVSFSFLSNFADHYMIIFKKK